MNGKTRRRIVAAAAVACCLALAAGGTLAYFTDSAKAHNVMTSGGIGIQIVEKTDGGDGTLVDFPEEGFGGVMPGDSVSKIVSVENTDKGSAWVRVRVTEEIVDADGAPLPLVIGGELTDDGAVKGGVPVMSYEVADGWLDGADGWWYCARPVPSGSSTGSLIEEVSFSPLMGDAYQGCTANVFVEAQAVQVANNPAPDGDVTRIAGWPDGGNQEGR